MSKLMTQFELVSHDDKHNSNTTMMTWLENAKNDLTPSLKLSLPQKQILEVQRGELTGLMNQFGFVSTPKID